MRFRYLIFAGLIATAVTGCPRKKDNTTTFNKQQSKEESGPSENPTDCSGHFSSGESTEVTSLEDWVDGGDAKNTSAQDNKAQGESKNEEHQPSENPMTAPDNSAQGESTEVTSLEDWVDGGDAKNTSAQDNKAQGESTEVTSLEDWVDGGDAKNTSAQDNKAQGESTEEISLEDWVDGGDAKNTSAQDNKAQGESTEEISLEDWVDGGDAKNTSAQDNKAQGESKNEEHQPSENPMTAPDNSAQGKSTEEISLEDWVDVGDAKNTSAQDNLLKAQKRQEAFTIIDAYLRKNEITALSTSSGSRYKILQERTGQKPKNGDAVTLSCQGQILEKDEFGNYVASKESSSGYLIVKFESSIDKSKSGTFLADPGTFLADLQEIVTLLVKGSKAQLFIPSLDDENPAGDNCIEKLEIEITDISSLSSLKKDLDSIDTYLEQNGITASSTSSGLRYSILQKGTDEKPEKGDIVTLSCRMRILTGNTVYIKLGKDLKEVEDVITLLGKGGEAQLFIPSSWGAELLSSWGAERFSSLWNASQLLPLLWNSCNQVLWNSCNQARYHLICEIKITDISSLKKDLASIDTYLEQNGITASSTSSGLSYKILQAGTGEKPEKGDIVTLSYRRCLLNGKYIDDQSRDPKTCKIKLGQDLEKVEAVITLLGKGGKAQLFTPFSWGAECFYSWGCRRFYSLLENNKLLSLLLDIDLLDTGNQALGNLICEIEIIDISSLKKDLASMDTYLEQKGITKLSTSSGLRYSILQEGMDEKPKFGDIVKLSCRRRPLNGEIGNQSVDSETCDIKLGKDLKEVEDVITLLGKGGKAQLFIPSSWGAERFYSWGAERFYSLLENNKLLSLLLDSDKQARGNLICEIKITDISSPET